MESQICPLNILNYHSDWLWVVVKQISMRVGRLVQLLALKAASRTTLGKRIISLAMGFLLCKTQDLIMYSQTVQDKGAWANW